MAGTLLTVVFVAVIVGANPDAQHIVNTLRTNAWAGIDVFYDRSETGVKSTYQVAPGADPGQIRLAWHGATVSLAEDGTLRLETPIGTVQETAPVAWQERDGQRLPVAARWAQKTLDSRWADLIERAAAWPQEPQSDSLDETLEFIRYTTEGAERTV